MSLPNPIIARLPLWVRKFVVDTVETFIAAVLVMSAIQVHEAGVNAFAVAFGTAAVAAARRGLPDALKWLREQLGVGD